ncbi:MAG: PEP-CTERM sorting domain-containing protein [Verrucomicrobia bacterium]|nr:PEP-CTERM sorting domain-containing protein [Verrucomicrobiota bacterium]
MSLIPVHFRRRLSVVCRVIGITLISVLPASGIVLYDTDFALANATAPTGTYENSGWAYQGEYGSFLGTMIGEQYFITAKHFDTQGSTFISRAAMNGAMDVTYTIDTSANGGQGYWDIAGTDLRILRINESFSSYAQLYSGNAEVGKTMVTFGRGGPRGAAVDLNGPVQGWYHTGSDGVSRWGANTVDAVGNTIYGPLMAADFDAVSGQQEATLSSGDSGGGVFIQVSGQWYLAGLNYGIEGNIAASDLGNGAGLPAAMFDKTGYYQNEGPGNWQLQSGGSSQMYMSRISASFAEINAIIAAPVPEPSSLMLFMITGLAVLQRSRERLSRV